MDRLSITHGTNCWAQLLLYRKDGEPLYSYFVLLPFAASSSSSSSKSTLFPLSQEGTVLEGGSTSGGYAEEESVVKTSPSRSSELLTLEFGKVRWSVSMRRKWEMSQCITCILLTTFAEEHGIEYHTLLRYAASQRFFVGYG